MNNIWTKKNNKLIMKSTTKTMLVTTLTLEFVFSKKTSEKFGGLIIST